MKFNETVVVVFIVFAIAATVIVLLTEPKALSATPRQAPGEMLQKFTDPDNGVVCYSVRGREGVSCLPNGGRP